MKRHQRMYYYALLQSVGYQFKDKLEFEMAWHPKGFNVPTLNPWVVGSNPSWQLEIYRGRVTSTPVFMVSPFLRSQVRFPGETDFPFLSQVWIFVVPKLILISGTLVLVMLSNIRKKIRWPFGEGKHCEENLHTTSYGVRRIRGRWWWYRISKPQAGLAKAEQNSALAIASTYDLSLQVSIYLAARIVALITRSIFMPLSAIYMSSVFLHSARNVINIQANFRLFCQLLTVVIVVRIEILHGLWRYRLALFYSVGGEVCKFRRYLPIFAF